MAHRRLGLVAPGSLSQMQRHPQLGTQIRKEKPYEPAPFKIPERFAEEEDVCEITEEDAPAKSLECDEELDPTQLVSPEGGEEESDDVDDEADFREHVYEYAVENGLQATKHLIALSLARAEKKLKKQRPVKKQKV